LYIYEPRGMSKQVSCVESNGWKYRLKTMKIYVL